MTDKRDKERRLDLVGANRDERSGRDAGAELVRAAAAVVDLPPEDHEVLLALTLGEGVSVLGPEERNEAESLRLALEGSAGHPLAELAYALKAAAIGAGEAQGALEHADHEAIVALVVGVDPSVDEEERTAAAHLANALERSGRHVLAELAGALHAATGARKLEQEDHDLLIALTVGEDIEASEDARELALALDERRTDHRLAELAGALRAAHASGTIHDLALERVLQRALPRKTRNTSVIVGALVALAAGLALFFGSWSWLQTSPTGHAQAGMVAALIQSRSTQDLFDPGEPFPARGGESDRIGKIVSARASDLRQNRFMEWGVP